MPPRTRTPPQPSAPPGELTTTRRLRELLKQHASPAARLAILGRLMRELADHPSLDVREALDLADVADTVVAVSHGLGRRGA